MKKHLFAVACLALAMSSCGPVYVVHQDPPPPPAPAPAPPEEISYQSFYDQLSPYGQWIDYPGYGNVWQPNVGPDFKPYASNGHWVYSEDGWVWASDYSWGWAAFHYGRWFYEDGYGWMWIPGYEWAPAWVSWRKSPDYYGWAPLGPNVSISVSIGGGYNPPSHYWNFVPQQYVTSPHVNNYYVEEQKNVTIINRTTIINNTTVVNNNITNNNVTNNNTTNNVNNNFTNNRVTNNVTNNYAGGPDPREVERATGTSLKPVAIRTSNTPGPATSSGNGQLAIYRPRVNPAPAAASNTAGMTPKPGPARVIPFSQVKPVNTTSYGSTAAPQTAPNNYQPANRNNTMMPGTPGSNTNNINTSPNINTTPRQPLNPAPVNPSVNDHPANSPGTFNNHPQANSPVTLSPVNQTVKPSVNQPNTNQPANFNPNGFHQGQHGTQIHADSVKRANAAVKPIPKAVVKPKPLQPSEDDKNKNDDRKKDKLEQ